ncbi:O-antigen ligase family protein [Propionigenium maris]|nr:O-antigen ligase family protein [Propionigenium maris]
MISFIIPLLVLGYSKQLDPGSIRYITAPIGAEGIQYDFFSYYREVFLGVGGIVLLLLEGRRSNLYKKAGVVMTCLSILSCIFAESKEVALWGINGRFEGAIAQIAYMAIFIAGLEVFREKRKRDLVVNAMLISSVVVFIIGIMQFFGYNFLENEIGYKLITGFQSERFGDIVFRFGENAIYGTHFNPNYMGSYAVIMFFIGLGRYLTRRKNLLYGCYTLLAYGNLVGSHSRAGQLGYYGGLLLFLLFMGGDIKKYWRKLTVIMILIYGVWQGMDTWSQEFLGRRMDFSSGERAEIYSIKPIDRGVVIEGEHNLIIRETLDSIEFFDDQGRKIEVAREGGIAYLDRKGYRNYRIQRSGSNENLYLLSNKDFSYELLYSDEKFYTRDHRGKYTPVREVERFKLLDGYENKGSKRGYIWSRSIPLLWTRPLLGWGQDNYVLAFPQDDFFGKGLFYGNRGMLVDKPHNYFLQIGINNGLFYLAITLILFGVYFIKGLIKEVVGEISESSYIFIASTAYMITLLFNDSVVSVAPVFWCIFSMGIVLVDEREKRFL